MLFLKKIRILKAGKTEVFADILWIAVLLATAALSAAYFAGQLGEELFSPLPLAMGAVSAVLMFACFLAHELAHVLAANKTGMPVMRIDIFVWTKRVCFGKSYSKPLQELAIALAGPLTSFGLAGIFFLAGTALSGFGPVMGLTAGFLATANLAIGGFNMIPGLPMDGGRILESIIWKASRSRFLAARIASWAGMLVGLGIIVASFFTNIFLIICGVSVFIGAWFEHKVIILFRISEMYREKVMERTAKEAMQPLPERIGATADKTVFCGSDDSLHEVIMLMHAHKASTIFVKNNGETIGTVTIKGINEFLRS